MPDDKTRDVGHRGSFWEEIVRNKFSRPAVLIFLILVALLVSFLVAKGGLVIGALFLILIVALPIVYAVINYPKIGIITLIIAAFMINYVSRLIPPDVPVGLVMDATTYLLIIGFFVRQRGEREWSYYFNNPISYFVLAWLAYNLFEFINPESPSILAWVYTVRTVGFIMLMYFIFVYHIRERSFIKLLFKLWLALDLLAAISAFQQENIGFFGFEHNWLFEEPGRVSLLFIEGHMRKFGIFSDPVVFAYNMVAGSILCIALILGDIKPYKKVILGLLACFFLLVMLYSGTRAAYTLLPVGLFMLFILKFSKKILVVMMAGAMFMAVIIFMPTSNPLLRRFQSAFNPSKDASFNVRAENQKRIQPYILKHPIGGGLGSVGVWGIRFAPNSFLAKFPPDSGYVRVAVEMGYIGLLLFCTLVFVILRNGINYYYLIKDPELKTYCLAMLLIVFALCFGNYPQQAFVQYPTNILFFLAMAILNVTMRLDIAQRKLNT